MQFLAIPLLGLTLITELVWLWYEMRIQIVYDIYNIFEALLVAFAALCEFGFDIAVMIAARNVRDAIGPNFSYTFALLIALLGSNFVLSVSAAVLETQCWTTCAGDERCSTSHDQPGIVCPPDPKKCSSAMLIASCGFPFLQLGFHIFLLVVFQNVITFMLHGVELVEIVADEKTKVVEDPTDTVGRPVELTLSRVANSMEEGMGMGRGVNSIAD